MGMKAVGAYLRTLREGRGLSRVWVAEQAGTNDTSIYRVEQRGQEAGPKILIGFVRAVSGSFDDIDELLKVDDLPVDVGVRLAEQRLSSEQAHVQKHINGYTADELSRVRDELASDPAFLTAIAAEILRRRYG
jgi:hypothetical protein